MSTDGEGRAGRQIGASRVWWAGAAATISKDSVAVT